MGVSGLTQRPSSFSVAGINSDQNQLGKHGFILVYTSTSQSIVLEKSWPEFKQEPKQKPRWVLLTGLLLKFIYTTRSQYGGMVLPMMAGPS